MNFNKDYSIVVNEKFFEMLEQELKKFNLTGTYSFSSRDGYKGNVLTLNSNDKFISIWCLYDKATRKIGIVVDDKDINDKKCFENPIIIKQYSNENYDEAVLGTYSIISTMFDKEIKKSYNYILTLDYTLYEINKMSKNKNGATLPCKVASFSDKNENYLCELLLNEEGFELEFYEKFNPETLLSKKFEPDLSSNVTLMLGLNEELNNFIDKELEHNIEYYGEGLEL